MEPRNNNFYNNSKPKTFTTSHVEVFVQPRPVLRIWDKCYSRAKLPLSPFGRSAVDKPLALLSLPPETQLLIYSRLCANLTVLTWRGTYASHHILQHLVAEWLSCHISTKNIIGILRGCRATNREATSLFCHTNLFHVSTLTRGVPCLRSHLRHVIISDTSAVARTSLVDAEMGCFHREIAELCPALEIFEVLTPDWIECIVPLPRLRFHCKLSIDAFDEQTRDVGPIVIMVSILTVGHLRCITECSEARWTQNMWNGIYIL